jgi:chemotaxis protein MotA
MSAIIGLVVLFICVFGGFVIAGGSLAPIIKATPFEMFIIGGAGVGGMITGNSGAIFKGAWGGMGRVLKGPRYHKEDYIGIIAVISKLMKTLKAEGAVAMESHVENPEASAIFGECPKMLADHGLVGLICDTIRLMVVSSGTLSPVSYTHLRAHETLS